MDSGIVMARLMNVVYVLDTLGMVGRVRTATEGSGERITSKAERRTGAVVPCRNPVSPRSLPSLPSFLEPDPIPRDFVHCDARFRPHLL